MVPRFELHHGHRGFPYRCLRCVAKPGLQCYPLSTPQCVNTSSSGGESRAQSITGMEIRRTSLLSGSTSLRLTPKPVREWLQTRVLKQKADCDELGNDDINYPTLFSVGWFCLCRWAVAPERKNCFLGKPQVTHLPMEDVANHFNLTWPLVTSGDYHFLLQSDNEP